MGTGRPLQKPCEFSRLQIFTDSTIIHGHIHGEFGRYGRHFNVASAGGKRAMVIDLMTMEHRVIEATGAKK